MNGINFGPNRLSGSGGEAVGGIWQDAGAVLTLRDAVFSSSGAGQRTGNIANAGYGTIRSDLRFSPDYGRPNDGTSFGITNGIAEFATSVVGNSDVADQDGSGSAPTTSELAYLFAGDLTLVEGVSTTFHINRLGDTSREVTIDWQLSGADAADFSESNGSVTLTAGQRSVAVEITTLDQDGSEADEAFTLSLSSADVVLGTSSATGTIVDPTFVEDPVEPVDPVETISGTDGDDILVLPVDAPTILGNSTLDAIANRGAGHVIFGGDGDDILGGGFEDDTIFGGSGYDRVLVAFGRDAVFGGDGNDTIDFSEIPASLVQLILGTDYSISLQDGMNTYSEDAPIDGVENIVGSLFRETIEGDDQSYRIEGGGGFDTLYGLDGDDTLLDGAGKDRMRLTCRRGPPASMICRSRNNVKARCWSASAPSGSR